MKKGKTRYDPANLAFLIHDVARLMRIGYDQKMKPLGLTRSQWWVLAYLQREDGLTQQELADVLDIGKVTLAGLLVRLEQKGWVERQPDTYDKRAKRVYLTDKVDSTIDAMRSVGAELLDDIVSALSEKERTAFESALQHMRQSLVDLSMSPEEKNRRAQVKGSKAAARSSRTVGG